MSQPPSVVGAPGVVAREAPYLVLDDDTETQPDVLVSRSDGSPLVVVEVMSRATKAESTRA